jgi:hypothetical protein
MNVRQLSTAINHHTKEYMLVTSILKSIILYIKVDHFVEILSKMGLKTRRRCYNNFSWVMPVEPIWCVAIKDIRKSSRSNI